MLFSQPRKIWCYSSQEKNLCRQLANRLNMPLSIATILLQRGLVEAEQVNSFLYPHLSQLPSPFLLKGMQQAVAILWNAITQKKPVTIFGDYDVDGITASAVLSLFLKEIGVDTFCFQPNRLTDGYGLNSRGILELSGRCNNNGGVLVTVDCGISDHEKVLQAQGLGFEVIVTDHHRPPPLLPAADAIINPMQPGCAFPFKAMAGVGVAFYLVMGLRAHLKEKGFWPDGTIPNLKKYLDLVAMGTICDMVPLRDVNRVLVKAGLEVMSEAPRPGVRSMLDVVTISGNDSLTAEDISYKIGPRINAAGRIGAPGKAFELLCTDNETLAARLARELDDVNNKRRVLTDQLYDQAVLIAEEAAGRGETALVLSGEGWHQGILGIVASRLLERYHRPTILLSMENGMARGSGRSIESLNLFDALSECGSLERYGGHKSAAGMTLHAENIDAFSREFNAVAEKSLKDEDLQPKLVVDFEVAGSEFNEKGFFDFYRKLSPFGVGNPEPVFVSKECELKEPRVVGRKHLKFSWRENGTVLNGIGFGFGEMLSHLHKPVDMAFSLRPNFFRGEKSWQLHVVDIAMDVPPGISS